MPTWLTGDLHVHSSHDADGFLSVQDTVERSKPNCDFIAISGHARQSENWGFEQYRSILRARKTHPGFFIFHAGEVEFPIERHAIVLTTPGNREFELPRDMVRRFDRLQGHEGISSALDALRYIEENWGNRALMIFNHPNHPAVGLDALEALCSSPVFKIIACYDRGERRAPQIWDVGAEWDQLLMKGHRLWVRFGSDFHKHFSDGHNDYYPGEFLQDQLRVDEKSYRGILEAYRNGTYFCTVDNIISNLQVRYENRLRVVFTCREPIDRFEIIGDGKILEIVDTIDQVFDAEIELPSAGYYRLRGHGREKKRLYEDGTYTPVFLSNPIFTRGSP